MAGDSEVTRTELSHGPGLGGEGRKRVRRTLTPEEARKRTFGQSRRGYDRREVELFLVEVAKTIESHLRYQSELVERLDELGLELDSLRDRPVAVDEETLMDLLGDEAARVLKTAKASGSEIFAQAEAKANALSSATEEQVAAKRVETEKYCEERRQKADEYASSRMAEADSAAASILEQAEKRAEAETERALIRGREMVLEAQAVRERVLRDLVKRQGEVRGQLELLRHRRDEMKGVISDARQMLDRSEPTLADDIFELPPVPVLALPADVADLADGRALKQAIADSKHRMSALRTEDLQDDSGEIEESEASSGGSELSTGAEQGEVLAGELIDAAEDTMSAGEPVGPAPDSAAGGLSESSDHGEPDGLGDMEHDSDAAEPDISLLELLADSQRTVEVAVIAPGVDSDQPQDPQVAAEAEAEVIAKSEAEVEVEQLGRVVGSSDQNSSQIDLIFARIRASSDPSDQPTAGSSQPTAAALVESPSAGAASAGFFGPGARLSELPVSHASDVALAGATVTSLFDREDSAEVVVLPKPDQGVRSLIPADFDDGLERSDFGRGSRHDDSTGSNSVVDLGVRRAEAGRPEPERLALEARDGLIKPVEDELLRSLKRTLADEQNSVLEALRLAKGRILLDSVLPDSEEQLSTYLLLAESGLERAAAFGAASVDLSYGLADFDLGDLAAMIVEATADAVRSKLERDAADLGEDVEAEDILPSVGAVYKEVKGKTLETVVRTAVAAAFSRGVYAAAPSDAVFKWVVDHSGQPSAECDDNALSGPTQKDDEFPTGALYPPVEVGCRCLIVPLT